MNLQCISEHTVDISRLSRQSKVLDLGCRAFTWSKAMLEYVDEVYCVDADPDFVANTPAGKGYNLFLGAVNDIGGLTMALHRSGNGTGNHVVHTGNMSSGNYMPVKSHTLKDIGDSFNIPKWDLIKFDIEGSEIPVLLSLAEPPADQLSIEFHLHTGTKESDVEKVFKHLESLGYIKIFQDYSAKHGCGLNYWDVLFILK